MKWIVGTIAIALGLMLLIGAVAVLGEAGFLVILLLAAFILLAPNVGEAIIDWYKERKFQREHPWPAPPPNLTNYDLALMRKHTHTDYDQAVMEDLGIMPEGPDGE